MIKHLLLTSLFIIAFVAGASAQCTPDPLMTASGIYPDTMAYGFVGQPYSQVLTVVVPGDTAVAGITATIDSIVVTSITGRPPTISYQCNPNNCSFSGNTSGCALFSGTPAVADTGSHVLHIIGTIYGKIFGSTAVSYPMNDSSYTLRIYPATSIDGNEIYSFEVKQNNPNPFIASTEISYIVPNAQDVDFKITNLLGQVQHQEVLRAKNGKNTFVFNAKKLQSGVYFYTITSKGRKVTHRMVVN